MRTTRPPAAPLASQVECQGWRRAASKAASHRSRRQPLEKWRPRPVCVVSRDGDGRQFAVGARDGIGFTGWRDSDSPSRAGEIRRGTREGHPGRGRTASRGSVLPVSRRIHRREKSVFPWPDGGTPTEEPCGMRFASMGSNSGAAWKQGRCGRADLQRFHVDAGLAVAGLSESHPDKRAAIRENRNQQKPGRDRPSVEDIKASGG